MRANVMTSKSAMLSLLATPHFCSIIYPFPAWKMANDRRIRVWYEDKTKAILSLPPASNSRSNSDYDKEIQREDNRTIL